MHLDAKQHNEELITATKFLQHEVIPELAGFLSDQLTVHLTLDDIANFPMCRIIHSKGVNFRLLSRTVS